jgi:hypothetical protein
MAHCRELPQPVKVAFSLLVTSLRRGSNLLHLHLPLKQRSEIHCVMNVFLLEVAGIKVKRLTQGHFSPLHLSFWKKIDILSCCGMCLSWMHYLYESPEVPVVSTSSSIHFMIFQCGWKVSVKIAQIRSSNQFASGVIRMQNVSVFLLPVPRILSISMKGIINWVLIIVGWLLSKEVWIGKMKHQIFILHTGSHLFPLVGG